MTLMTRFFSRLRFVLPDGSVIQRQETFDLVVTIDPVDGSATVDDGDGAPFLLSREDVLTLAELMGPGPTRAR